MPLKSTQTNKYETCCFVQEASQSSELDPRGLKVMVSADGHHYCEFPATLQTFGCMNRNQRRYDPQNLDSCIRNDERIQTLLRQNKWRGELNHPNAPVRGQIYTDQRMSTPEQDRTSHFIRSPKLEGNRYRAIITTAPGYETGRGFASDIIDIGCVPSFSARLFGTMIPNAPANAPNMRVTKVITYDAVDFPSHRDADGDVKPKQYNESYEYEGDVVFMRELAQYCTESSECMHAVCESFQITPEDITGITKQGDIVVEQHTPINIAKMILRPEESIRNEALNILRGR